jgi:hypothetical protein
MPGRIEGKAATPHDVGILPRPGPRR